MSKINIALGDFCHTTKIMANNYVPLNISLIASFVNKTYGRDVSIHLFKSVNLFQNFIRHNRTDIVGLSHYVWNSNLSQHLLQQFKQNNPGGITVFGGPNFAKNPELLEAWIKERPFVDFVVDSEGEKPFANIVEQVLLNGPDILKCKRNTPRDSHFIDENGRYVFKAESFLADLDEIPSPYLTGLLDTFLVEKVDGFDLYPLFESTRGCPYICSFCRNSAEKKKMRGFSTDYFLQEMEYTAELLKRNHKQVPTIMITDQNFGMYEKDLVIAEGLQRIQDKYGFPRRVVVTTGKGNYETVLKAVKLFPTIAMTFSVQSLDADVLRAANRVNFPLEQFKHYHSIQKSHGQYTGSEIILALPEDTREKHLATINTLLTMGIDFVIPFSFMLLPGTPSESFEFRTKYQYHTMHRLVPGAFSDIGGHKIFEHEEIVISTDSLSYGDYTYLRRIHLWTMSIFNGSIFKELRKLIEENGLLYSDFLSNFETQTHSSEFPSEIREIAEEFTLKTEKEFFDSSQHLESYYNQHYEDLLNDKSGENLLQKFTYLLYLNIDTLVEQMILTLVRTSKLISIPNQWNHVFELMRFKGKCMKCFFTGAPPSSNSPEQAMLSLGVLAWLEDNSLQLDMVHDDQNISCFGFYPETTLRRLKMELSQYGQSSEGSGRAIYRLGAQSFCPTIERRES